MDSHDLESSNSADLLRQELKEWEHEFALNNNGCKPGKADIKANPKIGMWDLRVFGNNDHTN
jgi:hypothetical protein